MKVGILCTMINGFGRKGFYNSQEIGLGRALSRRGNSVIIYKCLKKAGGLKTEWIRIEPGLTICYLPIRGFGAHGYLGTSILEKDLEGLFCFADNQIFLPHIYRFCRQNGVCFVPYVGTAHSLYLGIHAKVMNTWFAAGTLKIFQNNRVIAKTEEAEKELKALGVRNITVAPVGLDAAVLKKDFESYDRIQLRKEFEIPSDDVVLLSVARLEKEKRPLDLIEIFMHIRNRKRFRLMIVGEGPLRQEMNRKITEYGIGKEVNIVNRVPYEEMWKFYVMSDYFVNLNRNEIFGMAIMEAIYYKTSVAAVMAPGPQLTLQGMKGHCLCKDDQQVEEWLTDVYPPDIRLAESSEKVIRKFSWDKCADIFSSIVEHNQQFIGG